MRKEQFLEPKSQEKVWNENYIKNLFQKRVQIEIYDLLTLIMFIFYAFTLFYFSQNLIIDHDEILNLHASWLIYKGKIPYKNFFLNYPPYFHYLFAHLFHFTHNKFLFTLKIARFFMFIFSILSIFILYRIVLYLENKKIVFYAICFLSSFWVFSKETITFRPDNIMLFLLLLSAYLLILKYKTGKLIFSLTGGLISTFAFFFFPKAISLLIAIYFYGILDDLKNKKIYFLSGIAIGTIFSFMFLIIHNISLRNFYLFVFRGNLYYPWSSEILLFMRRYWKNFFLFTIFGVFGFYSILKNKNSIISFLPVFCVFNFIFYIIFIAKAKSLSQYWLPFTPFISILSSRGVLEVEKLLEKKFKGKYFIEIMFIIIFFWLPIRINIFPLISYDKISKYYVSQVNYILKNTSSNDKVLVYFGPEGEFYHPIFRKDASFIWYNQKGFLITFKKLQIFNLSNYLKDIRNNKPKFIYIEKEKFKELFPEEREFLTKFLQKYYKKTIFPDLYIRITQKREKQMKILFINRGMSFYRGGGENFDLLLKFFIIVNKIVNQYFKNGKG